MSQEPSSYPLPFLTRDMLKFEHATTFGVRINSQSTQTIVVQIRGMTREGTFSFTHTPLATGALESEVFRIPDLPIMINASIIEGDSEQGESWVELILTINGNNYIDLCRGFVTGAGGISWPDGGIQPRHPGRGGILHKVILDPATGANFTTSVPDGVMWRVIGLSCNIVNAAVAASRRLHLVVTQFDGQVFEAFSTIDQITGETKDYRFGVFGTVPDETDANVILTAIPHDLWALPGATIASNYTNKNAGDSITSIFMLVEQIFNVL